MLRYDIKFKYHKLDNNFHKLASLCTPLATVYRKIICGNMAGNHHYWNATQGLTYRSWFCN